MAYFKIGNTDYSSIVCDLQIETNANYNAQMNAAGDTVVDYINHKRTITVGIIPLTGSQQAALQSDISELAMSISFLNPKTNTLETNVSCILPEKQCEYYTIQAQNVLLNKMTLKFVEL